MRRASEILEQLGFNKEAPESTKDAFLKHLIRSSRQKSRSQVPQPVSEPQLSFDADVLNTLPLEPKKSRSQY